MAQTMTKSDPSTIEALLNQFSSRCFRDVADQDYIAARLSYRAGLFPQFHWSSLQALEKYLKAILLYNRVDARHVKHDLGLALQLLEKLPFKIELSDPVLKFIEHIDRFGTIRYLEASWHVHGPKLVELDRSVWELRRFCRVMNYDIRAASGGSRNMLDLELAASLGAKPPQSPLRSANEGELEKILRKKTHPARAALVWKNMFFTGQRRTKVKVHVPFAAVNSPLYLHPELLDHVIKFVYIPPKLVKAYRQSYIENPGPR